MTDDALVAGQCACGAVRFTLAGQLRPVVNCHCHRCRRISGHHVAATSADLDQIDLAPTDQLSWYEASAGVFYGFCAKCGSSLFWKNDNEPDRWSIGAGTLDPPTGLETELTIWTAEASDYHVLPDGPSRPRG
jgi:hypothetical protein